MKPDYLSIYKKGSRPLTINDITKANNLIDSIKQSKYCNEQTRELLNNINVSTLAHNNSNTIRELDFLKKKLFVYFECDDCIYCKYKRPIGKVDAHSDQSFYLYTWNRSDYSYQDIFNTIMEVYGSRLIYGDTLTINSYEEIVRKTTPRNIMDRYFHTWSKKLFNIIYKNEYNDPFEIIFPICPGGNESMTFCVNKKHIFFFDWSGS